MTRALAAALVVACTLPLVAESAASGQALEGVISGRVRLGTEGAAPIESLPVQLIVLGGGPPRTLETETQGDAFRFAVDADPLVSYVVRVVYRGVQYIAPPVLLSRELPTAEVELTVFETTRERPPLEIESTLLTVIALDRTNAQLTLLREDRVNNPGDRVYVGGEAGVTLRLPVPDGMVAADGSGEGSYRLEGGTLVATEPLRPGTTTVVTRYVVSYDRAGDAYTLRVTAPLPTRRMEIEVPTRFVDDLDPLAGAVREGERDVEGERVAVIAHDGPAGPGESTSVRLEGLTGRNSPNPLTGTAGAAIAVLLALAVVSGGAVLLMRARGGSGSAP